MRNSRSVNVTGSTVNGPVIAGDVQGSVESHVGDMSTADDYRRLAELVEMLESVDVTELAEIEKADWQRAVADLRSESQATRPDRVRIRLLLEKINMVSRKRALLEQVALGTASSMTAAALIEYLSQLFS